MKLLFLCTGNTCRSPMAKGIFEKLLKEWGVSGIECSSAGLAAGRGQPASKNALLACREIGVDLSKHRSSPLSPGLLARTDLFAVMTELQARALQSVGVPKEKITVLGGGVPDPFGGDLSVYRGCRDALSDALRELLDKLCGKGDADGGDPDRSDGGKPS